MRLGDAIYRIEREARVPGSLMLALLIALALFWLMQYLITPPEGGPGVPSVNATMEMVRLVKEPEQQQEPEQAAEAAAAGPPPPPSVPALARPDAPKIAVQEFEIEVGDIDIPIKMPSAGKTFGSAFGGVAGGGSGSGSGSGGGGGGGYAGGGSGTKPVTPLSTARPQIPQYACDRGIEGWVEAVYVVGTNGRVSNIRILDADPKGLFEAAMVESLTHWIYERQKKPLEMTQRVEMKVEDCAYNW